MNITEDDEESNQSMKCIAGFSSKWKWFDIQFSSFMGSNKTIIFIL